MQTVKVNLPDAQTVQAFVDTIAPLAGDFDLVTGNFVLDARSLMGIFSLDITQPIELRVQHDTEENMKAIAPFVAQGGRA